MSDVPKRNGQPPIDDPAPIVSVPICVRLSPRQYADLHDRAERDGVSVPERVRRDVKAAAQRRSV